MAKKQVAKSVARPGAKRGRAVAKAAATPKAKTKPAAAIKPAKKSAARKSGKAEKSLGRPLVTAEEKLYLLFKEDYHARQIFEFLRVDTVGELERHSPQEIIRILSMPVRQTVERIRRRLAENKRHLRDDGSFAREILSEDAD